MKGILGKSHEQRHGLLCRCRVPLIGKISGNRAIVLKLAVDQHAIEIEDDRTETHAYPRGPNNAVPTRTCVAPHMIAVS